MASNLDAISADRPADVYHCLSLQELERFIEMIGIAFEWVSETSMLVHATAGPVIWEWTPAVKQYCATGI